MIKILHDHINPDGSEMKPNNERKAVGDEANFMTKEVMGQIMYEREAKNWPTPVGWDKLPKGTQQLWIERAQKFVDKSPFDPYSSR